MSDVVEFEPFGAWIFALNGRVLEIFGPIHPGWNVNNLVYLDSWRIHVKHLNVQVAGPDKKGFHEVAFLSQAHSGGASPNGSSIVTFTKLDDAQRSRFQPLLDALANVTAATASGGASNELLATKTNALQALLSRHGVRLGSQPEDVRRAVVSDLQAAGIAIDPDSLAMQFTDPGQPDTMLAVYKRHDLLPADAAIG